MHNVIQKMKATQTVIAVASKWLTAGIVPTTSQYVCQQPQYRQLAGTWAEQSSIKMPGH